MLQAIKPLRPRSKLPRFYFHPIESRGPLTPRLDVRNASDSTFSSGQGRTWMLRDELCEWWDSSASHSIIIELGQDNKAYEAYEQASLKLPYGLLRLTLKQEHAKAICGRFISPETRVGTQRTQHKTVRASSVPPPICSSTLSTCLSQLDFHCVDNPGLGNWQLSRLRKKHQHVCLYGGVYA